jgi:hypothetical protein
VATKADTYVRLQQPEMFTYEELLVLGATDHVSGTVGDKLRTLTATPFISNEAYYRGATPHRPVLKHLGRSLRVVTWNIERGLELDGIKLLFANTDEFLKRAERKETKVDLVQMRQDIDGYFAWHRSAELPLYASRLTQWQALVKQDITPEQTCAQFEVVKAAYLRMVERSLEPLARLALQLTPAQLEHLQRHHDKGNETFEKDFLRGSPAQRLDKRLEQAMDRYETLYGPLSAAQATMIKTGLQQSPFDPQRSLAERLRRQTDLQKTIRQMQAAAPANGAAGNGSQARRGPGCRPAMPTRQPVPTLGHADQRQPVPTAAPSSPPCTTAPAEQRHAVDAPGL